jgi:tetratricopeptide (TPR) repeat protein
MNRPVYKHPLRIFLAWGAVLALVIAALGASDVAMLRYAEQRRAADFRTYVDQAGSLIERGRYVEAESAVRKAISLAPDRPEPREALGHLRYRMKRWEEAIEAYNEAIARASRDEGIRQNLVWSHIELQQFEEAARVGEFCIREGYRGAVLPRYIAEAYYRAGKFEQAIPFFEAALLAFPNDLYLLDHLRNALLRTGQRTRAQEVAAAMAEAGRALGQAVESAP